MDQLRVEASKGPGFRVVRAESYDEMSRMAAEHLMGQVRRRPDSLFILATGGSPQGTYEAFVRLACRGAAAQQHSPTGEMEGTAARQHRPTELVRLMKLDEWGGLEMDDPATCEAYLQRFVIQPLGIKPERYFRWQSNPENVGEECRRMAGLISSEGPADVCVLGLGINGHLGFNEPRAVLQAGPHKAELSPESMTHGMLKASRGRPGFGLTLGMRDILGSREIILLVNGAHKRTQLQRLLTPEISTQFPGSMLWLHPAVTIYCDREAMP